MAKDLNLCQFIGRLGNDPEIRFTPSGSAVANMSIACGDDYKDKNTGQKVEQTNWVKVVAFGRLAEIIQEYVKKGSQIHISGKQVTRKWKAEDGTDRYSTEIIAENMQMLGGNQGASNPDTRNPVSAQAQAPQRQTAQQSSQPAPPMDSFDPDIPF